MKFRLVTGKHEGADPRGQKGPDGRPVGILYSQGAVIEGGIASDGRPLNLVAKFGAKFERVPDNTPLTPLPPLLSEVQPTEPYTVSTPGYDAPAQPVNENNFTGKPLPANLPPAPPPAATAVNLAPQPDTYDSMTLEQLVKHCQEEDLAVPQHIANMKDAGRKRDELLKMLRSPAKK